MNVVEWYGDELPDHIRDSDVEALSFFTHQYFKELEWGKDYIAWAAYEGDENIGVGGLVHMESKKSKEAFYSLTRTICPNSKQASQAFLVLSDKILCTPVTFTMVVIRKMRKVMKQWGLKHIYVFIDTQHPQRKRWIERLGFQCERLLKKVYKNTDWWLYRWDG